MLTNRLKRLLVLLLAALSSFASAQETSGVGSLLVTYQTGVKGERLDRIRFRIKNSAREQQIHPKPGGFVDDSKSHTRIVAIEQLPVGTYTLQFLVPNKDSLFDEIPLREIVIRENTTLKIDQQIRPHN